jgi:hypothetical protein
MVSKNLNTVCYKPTITIIIDRIATCAGIRPLLFPFLLFGPVGKEGRQAYITYRGL